MELHAEFGLDKVTVRNATPNTETEWPDCRTKGFSGMRGGDAWGEKRRKVITDYHFYHSREHIFDT
jgi:hypothetical protein